MTKEVSEDKMFSVAAGWNYLLPQLETNKAISAASGPHLAQLD